MQEAGGFRSAYILNKYNKSQNSLVLDIGINH